VLFISQLIIVRLEALIESGTLGATEQEENEL